jgi:hypothetical protein
MEDGAQNQHDRSQTVQDAAEFDAAHAQDQKRGPRLERVHLGQASHRQGCEADDQQQMLDPLEPVEAVVLSAWGG